MRKKELSEELCQFSKWLKTSKSDEKRAQMLGNKICGWIKEDSCFEINRHHFGGSLAKGTSTLLKLDVDISIYVNYPKELTKSSPEDIMEFLESVRNDWKNILMRHTTLKERHLAKGTNAVKFRLMGFKFDLCPAINYSENPRDRVTLKFEQNSSIAGPRIKGNLMMIVPKKQHPCTVFQTKKSCKNFDLK